MEKRIKDQQAANFGRAKTAASAPSGAISGNVEKIQADDVSISPNTPAYCMEDLTRRNIETIARLEKNAKADQTPANRVSEAITAFCGSMLFVYVHVVWYGAWIVWNTLPFIPKEWRFDPKPFEFLTLIVSLESIFLSTFILISQNQQARLAERRNHLDLQINLLSEQENSKMLSMLASLCRQAGLDDDPEVRMMEEETRPEKMLQQIQEVIEKEPQNGKDAKSR